jgi:D-tyrosyl-tRNA(Tyr) deacylase
MSARDFRRLYNPKKGKYMFQHYTGGEWFNNLRDINPSLLKTGITGSGHQIPSKAIKKANMLAEKLENQETGEAIINSLKSNNQVRQKISNLIQGEGLRVI